VSVPDFEWRLRELMAMRGMFATSDLIGPLAERGIRLSRSQVYRLVAEPPERISLSILLALVELLDCQLTELASPVERPAKRPAPARRRAAAGGSKEPDLPSSSIPKSFFER
jgi:DNA-binding Xre family transcriptional regulator